MKLLEHEGKKLFGTYGIPLPPSQLIHTPSEPITVPFPVVLKAQVRSNDRKKAGGILFAHTPAELAEGLKNLFGKTINDERVHEVLVEAKLDAAGEFYASLSYDTRRRAPVLAVSSRGGSGIREAYLQPINPLRGLTNNEIRKALLAAGFAQADCAGVAKILLSLFTLFVAEKAIVAEINPILKTKEGMFLAGDAKIDLGKRRAVEHMGGDIAVIASGGGASLINMDALIQNGGRPANYAEYSGNPRKELVSRITAEVLSEKGLKACWVIGGTANFTDIFETMKGFVEALKEVKPKPNYPFVIRRGGPRQKEAAAMLKEFAKKEGFTFYIYGSEMPMVETAKIVVDLAYHGKKP